MMLISGLSDRASGRRSHRRALAAHRAALRIEAEQLAGRGGRRSAGRLGSISGSGHAGASGGQLQHATLGTAPWRSGFSASRRRDRAAERPTPPRCPADHPRGPHHGRPGRHRRARPDRQVPPTAPPAPRTAGCAALAGRPPPGRVHRRDGSGANQGSPAHGHRRRGRSVPDLQPMRRPRWPGCWRARTSESRWSCSTEPTGGAGRHA